MTRRSGRTTRLILALAVAVAASSWVVALVVKRRGATEAPSLSSTTRTIVPGVHMLSDLGPSAAYAIETRDGLILVDTGLEPQAQRVKSDLADLGLDWRTLAAIFLTHAHGDHCGGAEALRKATHATIYAGAGDADVIRSGGPRDAVFSTFDMPNHEPHSTRVDHPLKGGEHVVFGDVSIDALALPGHTPGSTGYVMSRGNQHILFTGDVIMQLEGKAVGTYSAYLAPRYRGDASTYLASLRELRKMPVPDFVLPGHPLSDPTPQNPRLSAKRWEEMLDDAIREMETLIARYERDGRDFLDGEPKSILPEVSYLGDLSGIAVYEIRHAGKSILVNAPGGDELPGFLRSRRSSSQGDAAPITAILLTSLDSSATSGVRGVVESTGAKILTAKSLLAEARRLLPAGPTVEDADGFARDAKLDLRAIPLRGLTVATTALVLKTSGKTVLFTGRAPIVADRAATTRLLTDLSSSRDNAIDYLASIQSLADVKPDVWLPLLPSDGQNANLYEGEWAAIVGLNDRAVLPLIDRSYAAAPALDRNR
jgi:glyoxylase-like metal-dependent hydrolase (beta-lactamase superfamily II)